MLFTYTCAGLKHNSLLMRIQTNFIIKTLFSIYMFDLKTSIMTVI